MSNTEIMRLKIKIFCLQAEIVKLKLKIWIKESLL